jgi:hypothetical protein
MLKNVLKINAARFPEVNPRRRIRLERAIVAQALEEFPVFNETRRLLTVFTRCANGPHPVQYESTHPSTIGHKMHLK